MSDFAEDLFADIVAEKTTPEPEPAFYPGSKKQIPEKPEDRPKPVAPAAKPWDRNPHLHTVNGVEMEFFTIGALAEAVNRKPVTIRSWEDKGIFPKARYRHKTRRLYTRRQIEGTVALCAKHGILEFGARPDSIPQQFTLDVIELWKEEISA